MRIITNNVPRDIIDGFQLTKDEREAFDYLNWKDIDEGSDSASFFRFKGQLYDLGEFNRWTNTPHAELRSWDGYMSESAFSAMVVRYANDHESVVVGVVLT